MSSEKILEGRLKRDVERLGGYCLKFLSTETGVPDRIVMLPGHVIFVELKSTGKTLSPKQRIWRNRMTQLLLEHWVVFDEKSYNCLLKRIEALINK